MTKNTRRRAAFLETLQAAIIFQRFPQILRKWLIFYRIYIHIQKYAFFVWCNMDFQKQSVGSPVGKILKTVFEEFYFIVNLYSFLLSPFLLGKPFVKQTWAAGLDESGRPVKIPGRGPSPEGSKTWPGVQGGTNWYAPSFSPLTNLFYLPVWEGYYSVYFKWDQPYEPGKRYLGGSPRSPVSATSRRRFMTYTEEDGYGAIRALDPLTGEKVWEFSMTDVTDSGLLTTATNVLFSGSREGYFYALDATSGKMLWNRYLGGQIGASPITYEAAGRQYVTIASGHAVFTFALPE